MDNNKISLSGSHNNGTVKPDRPAFKEWLPCIGIAIAAFVFNTTEFAPIALLSDIAKSLYITEAKAGLLITIYAWVVALASLPLILIFAGVERRKLMALLLLIFIISHLLSWQSYNYTSLLVSRIIVACHAIFWSVAAPLAVNTFSVFSLCIFWGISIMIFNLVFQDTVIKIAPDATAVAMSIYSGIYNIGIGSGALIGGIVSTHTGTQYVGMAGCFIGLVAISFYFLVMRRHVLGRI